MKHVNVLDMRPTQFAVGLVDVEHKQKKLAKMSPKQRKTYLADRPIQVVIGPNKIHYIIDHHHLARACWETGIKKVPVNVRENLGNVSKAEFWDVMIARNYAFPYDQFGLSRDLELLPRDVRGLADDPYRSLAWSTREAGGFNKTMVTFAEFRWAQYFRSFIEIEDLRSAYDKAIKQALKLCKNNGARKLPGFKK